MAARRAQIAVDQAQMNAQRAMTVADINAQQAQLMMDQATADPGEITAGTPVTVTLPAGTVPSAAQQ